MNESQAVLVIIGGSAACLDSPGVVSRLATERVSVRMALLPGARRFFGDGAAAELTGRAAVGAEHVRLGGTSPFLSAAGIPTVFCPVSAGDTDAVRQRAEAAGVSVAGLLPGFPAPAGRAVMLQQSAIVDHILAAVTPHDLQGVRILVTAGPTVEDLDPVRFISNRSSGRMGVALVRAAARRGAEVCVVHGPLQVSLPELPSVTVHAVRSAREMHAAVMTSVAAVDVGIFCAAVADFTPGARSTHKIKKDGRDVLSLELVRTPDILGEVGARAQRPVVVGFAAESTDLDRYAREKLIRKNCDLLCANDIGAEGSGFGTDTNRVTIYRRGADPVRLPQLSKLEVAHRILDEIEPLLGTARPAASQEA
jgi:phosphopantothenoylcysteine decarboxylase/phosphopantothenate--cysteine ligase